MALQGSSCWRISSPVFIPHPYLPPCCPPLSPPWTVQGEAAPLPGRGLQCLGNSKTAQKGQCLRGPRLHCGRGSQATRDGAEDHGHTSHHSRSCSSWGVEQTEEDCASIQPPAGGGAVDINSFCWHWGVGPSWMAAERRPSETGLPVRLLEQVVPSPASLGSPSRSILEAPPAHSWLSGGLRCGGGQWAGEAMAGPGDWRSLPGSSAGTDMWGHP